MLAAVVVLVVGGVRMLLRNEWGVARTPREVADILRQLLHGGPTGFLADDFVHIPIANPQLEQIRERFEHLTDRLVKWDPELPFPQSGRDELQRLIAEAEALDQQLGEAGRSPS